MSTSDSTLGEVLLRVRAEYRESPGMKLTKAQAQRLWGLDAITCDAVLTRLLETGFLRCSPGHGYVRADA